MSRQQQNTEYLFQYVGVIGTTFDSYWEQMIIYIHLPLLNTLIFYRKPTKNYRYALAFSFAIDEVNKNPDILPNISLAFGINADGCKTVFEIYKETQSSKYKYDRAPNYVCTQETVCSVMLSGPNWAVSAIIAQAMGLLTSQKVRYCRKSWQEILSPLLPLPDAKKCVWGGE